MAHDKNVDKAKRRFLTHVTTSVGAVGTGVAVVPFVSSMQPSARAKAAGAPVEVDISRLEPGRLLKVEWRGKPVWILRRTEEMLATLEADEPGLADPNSSESDQPAYATGRTRSIRPGILVLVGVCTHLGCSPLDKFDTGGTVGQVHDWPGGFFCPCHGSTFDLSGRVYKNVPAPRNLPVPPHSFKDDNTILVGIDHADETGKA
ncbi:MAG: ubiquinol-cytochrome c reductase iron-sulfur subunit [Gammaproteobacteria bacterium]|nr:ubiquinol-cytochrome c reductase iron-sulfur subunit [Gammaproteobacteria bacterium]